jgi:predicted RNase H-like nuclease
MQPANTTKTEMFGKDAPVWGFLSLLGGTADPLKPVADTVVLETYPVLAMVAFGWVLPDRRPTGRLPSYNPDRRKTFSMSDWRYVCEGGRGGRLQHQPRCVGRGNRSDVGRLMSVKSGSAGLIIVSHRLLVAGDGLC